MSKRKSIAAVRAKLSQSNALERLIASEEQAAAKTEANAAKRKRRKRCRKERQIANANRRKIGSYADYLKTSHWIKTRQRALKAAGHCCSICKATESLEVHHKTYALFREKPRHLQVLCRPCHSIEHENKYPAVDECSIQFRAMFR